MRRVLLALSPMAVLAGCVAPSTRTPPPAPPPVVTAPPPVVPAPPPADTGVEPGVWVYAGNGANSAARFGTAPQSTVMAIQCTRATRAVALMVARPGPGGASAMTLRATTMTKAVPTEANGGYAIARFNARDPILDALAFSRGRFGVALDGVERNYPTWPEFTRVLEDCRG